jgi:IS5 family transposase
VQPSGYLLGRSAFRQSVPHERAKARIGLKNLAYNMRRLVQLERLAAAAPP